MPFQLFSGCEYKVCSYKVEDGDTIDVKVEEEYQPRREHTIRLHGIDAPEYDQSIPHAKSSWGKLKNLCERGESLTILITDAKDNYGRSVGILYGHHKNWKQPLDINRTMVLDGYAYAYAYNGDDTYRKEDHLAKLNGYGIRKHLDEDLPPWKHRENQRYKPKKQFNWQRFLTPPGFSQHALVIPSANPITC